MLENEELELEKVIEEFEAMTKDAERVQRETLTKILEENGCAKYLQDVGLNGRTDPDSFKACVPLVTHKDLEPYIGMIADGVNSSILTRKPITTLSISSGTSEGRRKFFPFSEILMDNTLQMYRTTFAFRNKEYPVGKGKALMFNYSSKPGQTKGGVPAGSPTSNIFRNPRYKSVMKEIMSQSCSPDEVLFGPDFQQSMYCHLLCSLIFHEEIQIVSSTFAQSIFIAFNTFEQVWEDLCNDIRDGVLNSRVTAPSVREAVSNLLKPNPELADLIHKKCSELSNWCGLIPALFPNVKYMFGVMTGAMEPYLKRLRHYAGEVPLVSSDYGASEGWIGGNIKPKVPPELTTYVVLPNLGFYEFIPLGDSLGDATYLEPKPIGLTEVKIGEQYEVIVTNQAGLYRYKLGDVVKVMGFYNSSPELKFVCRRNLMLSINIDKNTEKDLQVVVEEAGKVLAEEKLEIVDFSSMVDLSTDPGHYVIFLEIDGELKKEEVMQECCNCLDKSFVDIGYIISRTSKAIGPLELRVVRKGTFEKILDHYLGLGAVVSQFKTPRCLSLKNKEVMRIMLENVSKTYQSTHFA